MQRPLTLPLLAAALAVTTAASAASAQVFDYSLLVSRTQAAGGSSTPALLGGFGQLNGDTYAVLGQSRQSTGQITRGTPGSTFDVLVSGSDFTFAGIDPQGFNANSVLPVSGNGFLFADGLNDAIIRYVPDTNVSIVASKMAIQAFTGSSSAGLGDVQVALPNGNLLFNDTTSDALLTSTPTGVLGTFLSASDLASSAIGTADVDGVAIAGNTLFLTSGSSTGEGVFALDLADGTAAGITKILGADDFGNPDGTNLDFRGLTTGNDGLVYAYEFRGRGIYRFDASDPAGTIQQVLTSEQLTAGPAGSNFLTALLPFGESVAFYNIAGDNAGLYQITESIPEPASLALLGLGGLGLVRRRRA